MHRSPLRRDEISRCKGIPVTTVPRLLIDLADELTAHQLANVIHEAAFRRLFNLEATREALARAHGRRVKTVERAVALHLGGSAGTKSSLEDAFLERCAVEPLVNTKVAGLEVDFCWPDRRLVVEVDGPGHARAPTRREDFERERKLEAAGYEVRRVSEMAHVDPFLTRRQ